MPVLMVDGIAAGIWERRTQGRRIDICVESFVSLDGRQRRQLKEEAARVGELLELDARLTIGPLAGRRHL